MRAALLTLLAVALVTTSASVATPLRASHPLAVRGGDCDNDGDVGQAANASHDEFLECSKAPPEPGKVLPPSEKAQAKENLRNLLATNPPGCPGLIMARDLTRPLVTACDIKAYWITRLSQVVNDPPDPQVSLVALAAAPRGTTRWVACRPASSTCGKGQAVALAYAKAFTQVAAATDALVTSLNRLSSTPATPEDLRIPRYTRRTQVAAARLYGGLVAAWSNRLRFARANVVTLLRGLGGARKRTAAWLPAGLAPRPLWAVYHQMNVYELAQLTDELWTQQILTVAAKRGPALGLAAMPIAQALLASKKPLIVDLNTVFAAKGAARTAAVRKLVRDAQAIGAIPGLGKLVPKGRFVARLMAFAAEALLPGKPAPPTVP